MVDRQKIIDLLTRHEVSVKNRKLGFDPTAYLDNRGHLSIGIGFNLDAAGAADRCAAAGVDYEAVRNGKAITQEQAQALVDEGITTAQDAATITLAGFMDMPEVAQLVVIDMLFNMGREKFLGFHQTIAAAEAHDWPRMVNEMRDSDWYGEVPTRAKDDIALVLSLVAAV